MFRFHTAIFLAFSVLTLSTESLAEVPSGSSDLEYNRDIRPILAENCFACHGADSAARKADLRLDKREAAIDAGAITASEPDASELIARIKTTDPDLLMPPPATKKTLSAEQVALLEKWIAAGAEYQPHWSFIPPQRPEPPTTAETAWAKNAIDKFVLSKLESMGLTPAPEVDSLTFFRRLHLDITGLPPSPDEARRFARDYGAQGDQAVSEWIDRLMADSTWGEHRARYWLDAARYADTHGLHFDNYREMWPYRDWVIRAFNANQPFDQFVVEQLAGDLLQNPTMDQRIATGFQRCNITTNEGGTIAEENLAIYAADRVQTFGWVFLGMTINCCQCHDHKFDPLTMRDFYSLAAYFRNTTQKHVDGNVKDGLGPVIVVPTGDDLTRWNALPGEIASATKARDERRQNARDEFDQWVAGITPESIDSAIPNDALLLHLPLNEGAGRVFHAVNAPPAESPETTDVPSPSATFEATVDVQWVADGKLGAAPVIRPGSAVRLGNSGNFDRQQNYTIAAWFKPASESTGGIVARMDEQQNYRGWDLWQQGRNLAVHIIDHWPDNAIKVVTKDAVLATGAWQHIAATYDGSGKPSGIKIYVNGKRVDLRTETGTLTDDADIRTDTPLRLGGRSNSQIVDGAAIQDLRLYARALPDSELHSIYSVAPLRALLEVPRDQLADAQKNALYEHFLQSVDDQYPVLARSVSDLEAEREAIRARSPVTHVQEERPDSQPMTNILLRGEYDKLGEEVAANTPASMHALADNAPNNRLGLAQWVVDPANPLTARVTVNRFWQELFGRGIVVSAEDFGVMGSLPSHPELLDWLAVEFRDSGWNIKAFYKMMFMSATYRQSSIATEAKLELDRDNVFLSRGPRFRMDAEMVRDYALSASKLLSEKMYGPSVKPYQPEAIWNVVGLPGGNTRDYKQDTGESLYRRTLYSFWKRMAPPPNMEAFNAPSREICTVRRERTNTPLQALVTLNDPQFVEAARHLAELALTGEHEDDTLIANWIGWQVLGRSLQEDEVSVILASKLKYLEFYEGHREEAAALTHVGDSAASTHENVAILAAWTMTCNQLLNLDETLCK